MESGVDAEEENVCNSVIFTVLWAIPLSLFAASVTVFLSLGVPALRMTGFSETNCSTQFVEAGELRRCSYECGNDFQQCEKEYGCLRVHVLPGFQREKTSVLAWDIDATMEGHVECSNYPNCRYRAIIKLYGRPGKQYKCYFDPSRPNVALLKAPPSPLPYVLAPALVVGLVLVLVILIRNCSKAKEQSNSFIAEQKSIETSWMSVSVEV
jgi:hypothetical protein